MYPCASKCAPKVWCTICSMQKHLCVFHLFYALGALGQAMAVELFWALSLSLSLKASYLRIGDPTFDIGSSPQNTGSGCCFPVLAVGGEVFCRIPVCTSACTGTSSSHEGLVLRGCRLQPLNDSLLPLLIEGPG